MHCATCNEPATAACTACGAFTCEKHRVRNWGAGVVCLDCHEKAKKWRTIGCVVIPIIFVAVVIGAWFGIIRHP